MEQLSFPISGVADPVISPVRTGFDISWDPVPDADLYLVLLYRPLPDSDSMINFWRCWTTEPVAQFPEFPSGLFTDFELNPDTDYNIYVRSLSAPDFEPTSDFSLDSLSGFTTAGPYPLAFEEE